MIKINKKNKTVKVTTVQHFNSIVSDHKYNEYSIEFLSGTLSTIIINHIPFHSVYKKITIMSRGDIVINNLTFGGGCMGDLKINCKYLFIKSFTAEPTSEIFVNLDNIKWFDCRINVNLCEHGNDTVLSTLRLLSEMCEEIGRNKLSEGTFNSIQSFISVLYRIGLGQYAIDMFDSIIIPSSKFPINENNEIILYKRCRDNFIVKLRVPIKDDNAIIWRSNSFNKIRVAYAIVDSIYTIKLNNLTQIKPSNKKIVKSFYDSNFAYKVGNVVKPTHGFNFTLFTSCVSGIHGFINIRDAIAYHH